MGRGSFPRAASAVLPRPGFSMTLQRSSFLVAAVLVTGCARAPSQGAVALPPLDSATAVRLCFQPDSVLRSRRSCVLRDQAPSREFYRKP